MNRIQFINRSFKLSFKLIYTIIKTQTKRKAKLSLRVFYRVFILSIWNNPGIENNRIELNPKFYKFYNGIYYPKFQVLDPYYYNYLKIIGDEIQLQG